MLNMWIHFLNWIGLLSAAVVALVSTRPQISRVAMMVSRFCYLVAIGTGILLLPTGWQLHPGLTTIKVVMGLAVIASLEIAFARKRHHQLSKLLMLVVGCLLIVVAAYGLFLTHGKPL
ncbi:YisL family protein [Fructilactobacillus ixorae]|uniref:YisL family protein n=1 Tax=Fructilactobacillus ixorae TaxID=1750535 RepID=A0ABY5C333_9LACO|nr:DUF1516 family protein [Fructilactobacillus ixorae]USS92846.1 YisL family protein [Fructilactobacillus ixorae]